VKPLLDNLIPRRIGTQVALLLVASILLAHLVTASVFYFLMPAPPFLAERIAAARLINLAGLLDNQADPNRRAELLQLALRLEPDLSILHGRPAPAPAPVQQRVLKALQVGGDSRIVIATAQTPGDMFKGGNATPTVAIQLAGDTMWLALSLPFGPHPSAIASPMIIATLLFFAIGLVLLSLWTARALTSPLRRFADSAGRFSLSVSDVPLAERGPTEIRGVARALNDMHERVRHLVEERTRTLVAIGHDLRTPITRMRLHVEAMESDRLSRPLLRELQTMQNLIHTVLCLVRDNGPNIAAQDTVRADLPSLVQTICDDFADAGRDLAFNGPSHLEIDCNPEQLARAITNLIDNALKYGQSVSVRILAAADNQFVSVEVEDDGPGIPDPEKSQVFEPFYRADAARTSDGTDSFGLGLSISQAIVRAHGGELELSNVEPHGLIARVRLPRHGLSPQATDNPTLHSPAAIGR
jgi:signal transduction histidine kinase